MSKMRENIFTSSGRLLEHTHILEDF
uniref:Uncharacterized protein n=1 Tax=Anguilla anguilla TaxID=7936 RepID=A0A0E9PVR7_ANGAN